MTELEQYKKAYATLVGRIDGVINLLEAESTAFKQEDGGLAASLLDTLITAMTDALCEAEEIFLDEDPEEE